MAGYKDTRQLIIDTLMNRPAGTEIQPENHQEFALAIIDYVRSVELLAGNAFIGFAEANTVPVQSDKGQCFYISTVGPGQTVNFVNFIDSDGNVISVSSPGVKMSLVTLIWNTQYWSSQIVTMDTNWSIAQQSGDSESMVMSQKAVSDALSTKVDKTDIVQSTGTSTTSVMSQKAVSDIVYELENSIEGEMIAYDSSSLTDGGFWYFSNGIKVYTNSNWSRLEFDVKKGDVLIINAVGGESALQWLLCDTDKSIISKAEKSTITQSIVNVTQDGYAYVNTLSTEKSSFSVINKKENGIKSDINKLNNRVGSIDDDVKSIQQQINNTEKITDYENDFYYSIGEAVEGQVKVPPKVTAPNKDVWGCKYLEIEDGDVIEVRTIGGNGGRAYCITDINDTVITSAPANLNTLLNPFVFTATKSSKVYVNILRASDTEKQFSITITHPTLKEDVSKVKKDIVDIKCIVKDLSDGIVAPCSYNSKVDIASKQKLRVLDIGNSFSEDSISYVSDFAIAENMDVSTMCFYSALRGGGSYKTFYDSWLGKDTIDSSGCGYRVNKRFGGVTQNIEGSNALEIFHSAIKDCNWDIIMIHQVSSYSGNYNDWGGHTDAGYFTEFLRILKTYQPQAMIGYLMPHVAFDQSNDTIILWQKIVETTKKLQSNYGIDFIVPVATAIENLRASNLLTDDIQYKFSRDKHHLGYGLARYVASATYYQSLLCRRYGTSVLGNPLIHTVTSEEKASQEYQYPNECVDVTSSNAELAQICAIQSCANAYVIAAPEGIAETLK